MVVYISKATHMLPHYHRQMLEMSDRNMDNPPHFLVLPSVSAFLDNSPDDHSKIYGSHDK